MVTEVSKHIVVTTITFQALSSFTSGGICASVESSWDHDVGCWRHGQPQGQKGQALVRLGDDVVDPNEF
jgi:hypothetical protein